MGSENSKTPLHDICDIYSLTNLICEPTYYYQKGSSTIDVVLTNQKLKIKSCGTVNTHLSDGHQLIYSVLKTGAPRQPARTVSYRSFKNLSEQNFNADLQSAPFHVSEIFEDPEDTYWAIHKLLTSVIDEHLPKKEKKVRSKHTPFMNKQLRKAIMNKNRLWRKYKQFPSKKTWESYRIQCNLTTAIRKQSIKTYFCKRTENGPKNEHFWSTIKPFMTNKGNKNAQELMIEHEDIILTDPVEVSNVMNKFYIDIAAHNWGSYKCS